VVTGDDVIQILETLGGWRIGTWIDGGWGIDALLGEQIRAHQDLDLVIHRDTCGSAQDTLAALGFEHATQAEPGLPARLVLRDPSDRQVDFHPVVFDADGSGWQEIPGGTWCHYPADGLRGRQVRCLTAELQISTTSTTTRPREITLTCAGLPIDFGSRCLRPTTTQLSPPRTTTRVSEPSQRTAGHVAAAAGATIRFSF
jgi:lincosamide nucleotidyltransferase A/C/D/E